MFLQRSGLVTSAGKFVEGSVVFVWIELLAHILVVAAGFHPILSKPPKLETRRNPLLFHLNRRRRRDTPDVIHGDGLGEGDEKVGIGGGVVLLEGRGHELLELSDAIHDVKERPFDGVIGGLQQGLHQLKLHANGGRGKEGAQEGLRNA